MIRISVWDHLSRLVRKGKLLAASAEKSEIDQWTIWFLKKKKSGNLGTF